VKFFKNTIQSCLPVVFLLCIAKTNGQSGLLFNKRFVECEDKWVAFEKDDKNDSYVFGFIYIDEAAGLTFNYEGRFTISSEGKFIPERLDSVSIKHRLQPNNVQVAIIPFTKLEELQAKEIPDWLKYYRTGLGTAKRLQRWGYYYNDWGMSDKALEYLEPGYKLDPDFQGMAFELGFAYNTLERYEQAIPVITKALELSPKECYLYKELVFAQCNTDKLADAENAARVGLPYCNETEMKAEITYNIAYQYYKKRDKENFAKWAVETKKWAAKDGLIDKTIRNLEEKMKD
jgi:tetratricopeptide (TPR) repeat protein